MNPLCNRIDHVYVVDDDEMDQYLVNRCIKKLLPGAPINIFPSGEAFLAFIDESIQRGEPDVLNHALVTIDLNMPGIGGLETLELIQDHFESSTLSCDLLNCFVLTSSNSEFDRADTYFFQFVHHFITKPLTTETLKEVLSPEQDLL